MVEPLSPYHYLAVDTALEFVDTLELEHGAPYEHLTTTVVAIDWLQEHGLLHEPCDPEVEALREPGPAADRALERIRRVRAALRELIDATVDHRRPAAGAVGVINRAMLARQRFVLTGGPDGVALEHRHVGDPIDDVLARISERIARQLIADDVDRLRICADDSCRWVFFDSSRTGRRRWCDMNTCGNRAKAARHRARAKVQPGAAEAPGGAAASGPSTASEFAST